MALKATINATPGKYIFLAIPTDMGSPIIKADGIEGGFYLQNTLNYTNQYDVTISYNIYCSEHHSLGSVNIEVL